MIRTKIHVLQDGYAFLSVSPRLALMYRALKRPGKGGRKDRLQCAYFGFETEERAHQFVAGLKRRSGVIRVVVRGSDRLPESAWEVKVWEFEGLLAFALHCAQAASPNTKPLLSLWQEQQGLPPVQLDGDAMQCHPKISLL
jgi:hypothetical protein